MSQPLVGRSAEVDAVAASLGATDGAAAALVIEGDPGIGKTTLWLDGLERARRSGLRVLTARPSAAESVLGYATLADLLADVDRGLWTDLPLPQREGLQAALLSDYGASLTGDPRAVGSALLAVLQRMTAESPIVVAIDDLQWIDASSAAAVAFVARRLPERVLWLCTARSDAPASWGDWWQLGRPDAVDRLRLAPLTVNELHDVLIAQLGGPSRVRRCCASITSRVEIPSTQWNWLANWTRPEPAPTWCCPKVWPS